jgi:hypothetical protein
MTHVNVAGAEATERELGTIEVGCEIGNSSHSNIDLQYSLGT